MDIIPVHWTIKLLQRLHFQCTEWHWMLLTTSLKNLVTRPPSLLKNLNTTGYVMPVVLMTLAVLAAVVFTVFFYKKHSEFWKWTHFRYYRHNNQMNIHLDDMHDIVFTQAWETSKLVPLNSEWWHLYRNGIETIHWHNSLYILL
jgi:hypothetical protein